MNVLLLVAAGIAALLFIIVSAVMNALFLSSLGRTALEAGLLAAVSIAADIVKAILPVVIIRAIVLGTWLHGAGAAVLLAIVVALSLASGTGFAALTRGTITAARDAEAGRLATQQQLLRDIETQLGALAPARPSQVLVAELDSAHVDRRWLQSKSCTDPTSPSMRQYCGDLFRLRAELALAGEREKLTEHAQALRASIDGLRSAGAGIDSDPQVAAIADLLGADRHRLRLVLTTTIAIVLELGAVISVLLLAGPTLRGWREPGTTPPQLPVPARPATLPVQADREHWRRQRSKTNLDAIDGGDHHAR